MQPTDGITGPAVHSACSGFCGNNPVDNVEKSVEYLYSGSFGQLCAV